MKPRFRLERGRLIPIQRMPYGFAVGCYDLNGRGKGYGEITVWPKSRPHPLFTGGDGARPVIMVRGVPLWKQEMYVYLLERKQIVWATLKELEKEFIPEPAAPIVRALPDWGPWKCKRCNGSWERGRGPAPERCLHCGSAWWQWKRKDIAEFDELMA